jgi:RHS repeat-associated protein
MSQDKKSDRETGGQTAFSAPSISLPKGGGAIRGIGEKFGANPVTGSGSLNVPLATSPGRSGFGPQLSLSYDSGSGNGPFGFGWSLGLPSITRKTDKGLPRYLDGEESDVFLLSGAEDLVPALRETRPDVWSADVDERDGYVITRYRPRIEGLFARIERWTRKSDGDTHWRSLSKDNATTLYGKTAESRIADPADARRVFNWLICESYDDKGNAIVYEYAAENEAGIDRAQASERNRVRTANRYLKSIRYGNRDSRLVKPDLTQAKWLFEVLFDYDEGHYEELDPANPDPAKHQLVRASASRGRRSWSVRPDPFSSHRAGFEVRTYRRCRRVLMFHCFAELGTEPCLVRATEFDYADLDYAQPVTLEAELDHPGSTRFASFIRAVTQSGFVRVGGDYLKKSLPPLEFEYSRARIQDDLRELDAASRENLPIGLDGATYQWVDLDGEGLSGFLTEQAGAWFYKPSRGEGRFGPLERVAAQPSLADLKSGRQQLLDLAGDGQLDLASFSGPTPGFFERTEDGSWEGFRAFERLPDLSWDDPNLRFVDLNGDGRADVLITEDEVFTWYPSLAEEGFGPAERVRQARDEEQGPRLVLADGAQSIYLADMCGDGLTDLVRIRNGEICYWPNQGYGRFGAKVTMDGAPWLDHPDQFNQQRVRLADIDGSGATDILYLGRDGIRLYFNQSGNRWSGPRRLSRFPHTDNLSSVLTADLLGNGTACLVWSSPLPGDARRPLRYIDLMGGQKPHLLIRSVNNLGAETHVHYAASTKFYLADKLAGKPWITRIPFPVHVVERVETHDRVSGNRFVTRHAYHHGYFDGEEREFRGFGMVEQWDTEEIGALGSGDLPPVLTRTWFHTGVYLGRDRVSDLFAAVEYYREPGLTETQARELLLDDTHLPGGLTLEEEREACRALKGSMLRQEVYALDGTVSEKHPYTVAEQSFTIRRLQPGAGQRHAVFFTHARESLTYHYERDPADPRIAHALTLEVDAFGNVLKSAAVGYGRRQADPDLPEQSERHVTCTENDFTNPVDKDDAHRTPLPCESRTYELTGYTPSGDAGRFRSSDLVGSGSGRQRRLIEQVRTLYRGNDLAGALKRGELQSLALPFETYKRAFTPELLTAVHGTRVTDSMLAEGGYVHSEGDSDWWIPSGRIFYSPDPSHTPAQELAHAKNHFFLPHRHCDPFGTDTFVRYDGYDLLVEETRDALDNRVNASQDYRVLQPALVMDPNRNRSAVAFDALGMVVGTAAMGKPEDSPVPGDRLTATFSADLTQAQIDRFFADPKGTAATLLDEAGTRIVYDLKRQPAFAAILARETHASEPVPAGGLKIQVSFSYSDGFGREIQKKIQAEPATGLSPRWVGSGWTVFNNKGKPVRKYEPFFTDTHRFEFDVRIGVSPVLFYDPVERVVATLHPNHTWEKVVFDAWKQATWDVNDTIQVSDPKTDPDVGSFFRSLADAEYLPTWHARREGGALGAQEQAAAQKAAIHAATPAVAHLDSLGRTFLTIAHNKLKRSGAPESEERFPTRILFDIEGNERQVTDAKGRVVMRYAYDMLSNRIHQASMEAGERWMLNDIAGKPLYAWDSRDHRFRTSCDRLRRPVESYLREGTGPELRIGQMVYGESRTNPEAHNLRGKIVEVSDQAGVVTTDEYDFKSNLLQSQRQLAQEYKKTLDWSAAVPLETATYASRTRYDALNRPTEITMPDNSVIRHTYNEANLLERVEANLRGAATATPFVTDIDYDAKGQRTLIDHGNGVRTTYQYDPLTFRLKHLLTRRDATAFPDDCPSSPPTGWPGCQVQNLHYTYDPAGNITHIRDDAQQKIFFKNRRVEPSTEYTYDAVYRLIEATGREHLGGTANPPTPPDAFNGFHTGLAHPNDDAIGTWFESYVYDAVGNFLSMQHRDSDPAHPGWKREYTYDETKKNNQLIKTTVGATTETYSHDMHGNITAMPHLPLMQWDFRDQLQATSQQVATGGAIPETTWYVYDAGGQRVRKVTESAVTAAEAMTGKKPARMQERIYLAAFEIHRKYETDGTTLKLERETLHILDSDRRVALIETRTAGTDPAPAELIRYQYTNHLGSAALDLDKNAQIISYEEYFPYGSSAFQAVRGTTETPKRYRYTGKEWDEGSGFTYHDARYYVPWLGRWASSDPAGLVDGTNLYAYTQDNPVTFRDRTGRKRDAVDEVLEITHRAASIAAERGDAVADLKERAPDLDTGKVLNTPEFRSYGEIQAALKTPHDIDKGFESLRRSLHPQPIDARYRKGGQTKATEHLYELNLYVDEENKPVLLGYRSKGSVNEKTGGIIGVRGDGNFYDPEKHPGIVVSWAVLRALVGGRVGDPGDTKHVIQGELFLGRGSLGRVKYPDRSGVASLFADVGPPDSSGETSVKTAQVAGVLKMSKGVPYTDYDAATVNYDILIGTESRAEIPAAELQQKAVQARTERFLREKLSQRADQLFMILVKQRGLSR